MTDRALLVKIHSMAESIEELPLNVRNIDIGMCMDMDTCLTEIAGLIDEHINHGGVDETD